MKFIFKAVLLFFCFSSSLTFAATESQVERFFEVSGYNKQVEQYPALMKKGLDMASQQKKKISEEEKIKIESLMVKHFSIDLIKSSMKKQIIKSVSDEDMETVLKFYDTDIAKYFTELEVNGTNPEIVDKIKTFNPDTMDNSIRDEIDKIYFGLNMLEETLETQKIIRISMFQVINVTLPKDKQKSIDDLNEMFNKSIEATKPIYEKLIKTSLYVVYEPAPLLKLKVYTEYLNSNVVKNFYKQFIAGKREAFKIASENFASALMKEFKKEEK